MIRFTPLHDRLLVRRDSEEETTASGLYIPAVAQDKPQIGTVIAAGNGRYERGQLIPIGVKEGDTIVYGKYSGSEIKIDSEDFLILREEEVFGIMHKAQKKTSAA